MYSLLHLISRRIATDGGDARRLRKLDPLCIGVDDNDVASSDACGEQLLKSLLAAATEAREHDMIVQGSLDLPHAPILPPVLDQKFRGRSEEDEPQENAYRRYEEGVDQARPFAHWDDIAITDRRNGDHREIDDVRETEVTVDVVAKAISIEPQQRESYRNQKTRQSNADC